jgi:hypothetical protein
MKATVEHEQRFCGNDSEVPLETEGVAGILLSYPNVKMLHKNSTSGLVVILTS